MISWRKKKTLTQQPALFHSEIAPQLILEKNITYALFKIQILRDIKILWGLSGCLSVVSAILSRYLHRSGRTPKPLCPGLAAPCQDLWRQKPQLGHPGPISEALNGQEPLQYHGHGPLQAQTCPGPPGGKKHPHLPVRDDLNWENLANKPAPAFWKSPEEAEALHRCIWRKPLWPNSGSLRGSPSCWPCVGLPSSLTQAFLCRSAHWGRQGESSILASLIFQGSLKPGQNLFATGRRMLHADTVISTGQASHTAENDFLHVKNIPVGWNKQN